MKRPVYFLSILVFLYNHNCFANVDEISEHPARTLGAAELSGMDYAAGASHELSALHIPSFDGVQSDDDDIKYYRHFNDHEKQLFILMTCSTPSFGVETWMSMYTLTHDDQKMMLTALPSADTIMLAHLCDFTGATTADLKSNLESLFGVSLSFSPRKDSFAADFTTTYVDATLPNFSKHGLLIFGIGMRSGCMYWINRALNYKSERPIISLENYFVREFAELDKDEQAYLAIAILSHPSYSRKKCSKLNALFAQHRSRIQRKLKLMSDKDLAEFCRWSKYRQV